MVMDMLLPVQEGSLGRSRPCHWACLALVHQWVCQLCFPPNSAPRHHQLDLALDHRLLWAQVSQSVNTYQRPRGTQMSDSVSHSRHPASHPKIQEKIGDIHKIIYCQSILTAVIQ